MTLFEQGTTLEERVKEKIAAIDAVASDLPSVIIIHNLKTRSVEYMSERGLRTLNTTLKELHEMGPDYFERFFNPEDARNYTPKFLAMLEKNDPDEVFAFFQQVCKSGSKEWSWYLSASKVLLTDDNGKPHLSITAAHPVDELKSVTYKIERLLEENNMMRNNIGKFLQLTGREKEVVSLLANGMATADIAQKLQVSPSTVDQHRHNIKNKLGTRNLAELVKFAQAFNMI